jgi:TPR repeat protein
MADLGRLHHDGLGGPQDYTAARQWWEKAAARGHGASMNSVGVLYEKAEGVPKDLALARQWYDKAAAAGDNYGMNNVGRSFEDGWNGPRDYVKAREWYEKGITADNKYAKSNLAKMLDEGRGGPADFQRAAKLVLDAARSGNTEMIDGLRGDMQKWSKDTRTELKRELTRLGVYKGPIDNVWDDGTRTAILKYLGQGR